MEKDWIALQLGAAAAAAAAVGSVEGRGTVQRSAVRCT